MIFGNDKIVETGGLGFRVILKVYRLGDQEFQAVLDHVKLSWCPQLPAKGNGWSGRVRIEVTFELIDSRRQAIVVSWRLGS